jgi:hypothetical protein
MARTTAVKQPAPLLDPRDREALLDAGNRLLLEGLGSTTRWSSSV